MLDTNKRTVAISHLIAVYLILLVAMLINGYYGFGYPFTHFLIELGRFDDFYNSIARARVLPAADSSYLLSPGVMFIFRMIHGAIADLAFAAYNALILYLLWGALGDFRLARSQKIGLLLTYPILFALCRGNAEIVAFALLLKSLGQWHQGHHRAALALLLVSIYIKPTAAIWLAVFPVKELLKEWRLFLGYLAAMGVSILQIDANPANFLKTYFAMLKNYEVAYVFGSGGDLFNNSLWGLFKSTAYYDVARDQAYGGSIKRLYRIHMILGAVLLAANLYVLAKSYKKNLVVFSIALALVPTLFLPVSADYRLVYYLVPLVLLAKQTEFMRRDLIVSSVILMILLPKHFVQFTHIVHNNAVTIQSLMNPLLSVALLLLLISACKRTNSNEMPVMWIK